MTLHALHYDRYAVLCTIRPLGSYVLIGPFRTKLELEQALFLRGEKPTRPAKLAGQLVYACAMSSGLDGHVLLGGDAISV